VANSNAADILKKSSNISPLVDLVAPGTNINGAVPGNTYKLLTGTSMAAPHVTGAYALLRNAVPTANVDQILNALKCSGKVIHQREAAGGPVEAPPQRPRIDLLGAYNFLKKVPNAARTWNFSNAEQGLDFSIIRGKWAVGGGRYSQTPILQGWIGTAIANCYNSFTVTASMTRTDPGTTFFSNTGIIVDAVIDYQSKSVTGYWIAYNKCPTKKDTGVCTGDTTKDKPGQAVFWRFQQDFDGSGSGTLLCVKFSPVNVNGLNTVKVVNTGNKHSYYLNGKLVCTVTDATYPRGQVVAAAYIAQVGGHSYQLDALTLAANGTGVVDAPADGIETVSASGGSALATAGMSIGGSVPQN
jgi:subtilisin family serine protease